MNDANAGQMSTSLGDKKKHESSEDRAQRLLATQYALAEGRMGDRVPMSKNHATARKASVDASARAGRLKQGLDPLMSNNAALQKELEETRKAMIRAFDPEEQLRELKRSKQNARNERRRNKRLEGIASQNVMTEVMECTNGTFTKDDLEALRQKFLALKVKSLDVGQFSALMTEHYPELSGQDKLLQKLFVLFDTDCTGTVDFKEFAVGLAKSSKCTLQEKAQMMFSIFDENGDGRLSQAEIRGILREGEEGFIDHLKFTSGIFELLDADGNGRINGDEFIQLMVSNPALMGSFSASQTPDTASSVRACLPTNELTDERADLLTN